MSKAGIEAETEIISKLDGSRRIANGQQIGHDGCVPAKLGEGTVKLGTVIGRYILFIETTDKFEICLDVVNFPEDGT